jgi:hypothetical protein
VEDQDGADVEVDVKEAVPLLAFVKETEPFDVFVQDIRSPLV